ncbi:hypothetical protein ACFQH8_06070 [Halomicroarcula sp. GCM10025710]
MVDSSSEELVAAYLADREWDEQRVPVVKTAGIVQDLAAVLLEAGSWAAGVDGVVSGVYE